MYVSPHCPFPSFEKLPFFGNPPFSVLCPPPFESQSSYVRLLLTKPSLKLYLWYIKTRKESSMDTGCNDYSG